jgi:hypothetical protein
MKILLTNSICFLLSAIFLTFVAVDSVQAQTEKEIVKIRSEVAAINKGVSKYTKTTKNVEDISLEGTEATYYHSAKNLRKITAEMFGETFNATGEFYYRGGELIFAFIKHNKYDTQIGMNPPPKVIGTEEQRFYFADGKLIRLLIGKKELKSGGEKYSELKDQIISITTKLKNP